MDSTLKENNACIESKIVNDLPNCKQGNDLKVKDCPTDSELSKNHVDGDVQLSVEKNSLNNDIFNNKGDAADADAGVEKSAENNEDIVNDVNSTSSPNVSPADTNIRSHDNTDFNMSSKSSPNASQVEENAVNSTVQDDDEDLLADDPSDVPVVAENEDRLLGDDDSLDEATKCDKVANNSSVDEASLRESQSSSVVDQTENSASLDDSSKENAVNVEKISNRDESERTDKTVTESIALPDDAMVIDENTSSSSTSLKPGASSPEPMDTLDTEMSKKPENNCSNEKENVVDSAPIEDSALVIEDSVDSASKMVSKSVDSDPAANEDDGCDKNNQNDDSSKDTNSHPCTEVFHVDDNDDGLEMIMDSTEKDPIAQDNENAESPIDSSNKNVDETERSINEPETSSSVADENSKDGSTISAEGSSSNFGGETEETSSKNSSKPESNAEKTSVGTEKAGEEENCIIPDTSDNAAKEIKVIARQVRKFDITPVRLEKLMDPSKLAAVKLESDSAKNSLVNSRPQRQAAKKAETQIKEIVSQTDTDNDEPEQNAVCNRCSRLRLCKYIPSLGMYSCADCMPNSSVEKKIPAPVQILSAMKTQTVIPVAPRPSTKPVTIEQYSRKCAYCTLHNIVDEKSLSWEGMDFCNEECINRYQVQHGSYCAYCNCAVQHVSMGKYAVRFGLEARQFCSGICLEEFKKGLKSCSYCQLDITNSSKTVCASVGEKQTTLKEFCSKSCVEKYELMSSGGVSPPFADVCTVCANKKTVEIQVSLNSQHYLLCSETCFRAFKFGNNILDTNQCVICKKFYPKNQPDSFLIHHDDSTQHFCSKICMNVFILFKRKIVPCSWCKVKKYNFDMIKKTIPNGACVMMCSLNCLTLYQVSMNASSARKIKCDLCSNIAHAQYHLTMSDATIRNFCSYNCVMVFQTQYNKTPLTLNEQNKSVLSVPIVNTAQKSAGTIANGLLSSTSGSIKIGNSITVAANSAGSLPTVISTSGGVHLQKQTKYIQQIIVKPPEPKDAANKFTQCRPTMSTKGVSCRPALNTKGCQTDESSNHPAVLPIPVPIYVPFPMHMYTTPFPVPVPFALPIPVPIFIPTTQKTFKGIMSQMKEILEKTPSNPFEADLLLMAKMVAGEDKNAEDVSKNESGDDGDTHFADPVADSSDSEMFHEPENSIPNNFNDEMLQSVMKMANEQLNKTPTVDLEAELTSNTITPQTQVEEKSASVEVPEPPAEKPRTRKRTLRSSTEALSRKRTRSQSTAAAEVKNNSPPAEAPKTNDTSSPPLVEGERADASMCLKYTIGVRAWKQWVISKNERIEHTATLSNKKAKLFNTNILKLTTDELNYLLCMFVKDVRKPNGIEYAPDTIYYLCLSIQQYLFENGRIDNIFTDSFYEPFTNALDEVARKFSDINDTTQYIVTRVEEEHLWESKQLGAHSPHVLLATLMFFNTKYFNLSTLEEHMQLSFSHIMKHWKRNPNTPAGKPGSPLPNRNVVLRFYPPQAALDAPNSRKKKVYEQHENEVNPLRCPVKLYEFYLSKCPESVKQRNDVFYLQPERSCVPDSPVWYSTMPLQKDLLMKMLHRIRMVKEVNISLLAS